MNIQGIKTDGKFDPKKVAQYVNDYGAYGLCDLLNNQLNGPQETPITDELLERIGFKWDIHYEGHAREFLVTKEDKQGKKRHNLFVVRKYDDKYTLELNVTHYIDTGRDNDQLIYSTQIECHPSTIEQIAVIWELHTGQALIWKGEVVFVFGASKMTFTPSISPEGENLITWKFAGVEVEAEIKPEVLEVVRGNVVINKQTGYKSVVRTPKTLDGAEYELVCESAHDDDDFSYLCTNEYCRCQS
jgi:hypothetical protein